MPPVDADFCIEIDFKRGSESPSRVFRTMTSLIERFQEIDRELVQSVDVKIQPVLLLEDIQASSLKVWLKQALTAVDDDALKNLDWRPAVGKYLVKAKYILIDFMSHTATVSDRDQIISLQLKLLEASVETDVKKIPQYAPLPPQEIAKSLHLLSSSTAMLEDGDSAKFITADKDEATFNLGFSFTEEAIEQLLTREIIESRQVMILKVKKPDYLGDSMWEFRFEDRTIDVKITDSVWLQKFQSRQEPVQPGDAIRGEVLVAVKYGYDGEVIGIQRQMLSVHEVIKTDGGGQQLLLSN